jgi:hypothetical protein
MGKNNKISLSNLDTVRAYLNMLTDSSVGKEKIFLKIQKEYFEDLRESALLCKPFDQDEKADLLILFSGGADTFLAEQSEQKVDIEYVNQALDGDIVDFLKTFQNVFTDAFKRLDPDDVEKSLASMILFIMRGTGVQGKNSDTVYFIDECIKGIDEKLI